MLLSSRFDSSLHYATLIHAGQIRKGSGIPYISHLLAVTSLALEFGANEDETIGALLHDAAEDAGGEGRIQDIELRFGANVTAIVRGCSDCTVEQGAAKPSWHQRKLDYIAHISAASPSVRLVSACDKLHNSRAILLDYRTVGEDLWQRFSAKKAGTLWYYWKLAEAFHLTDTSPPLVDELERTVRDLFALCHQPWQEPVYPS